METLESKVRAIEWIGGTAVAILIALCVALATPLLDYIVKPVVERFSRGNPPAGQTTGTMGASTPSSDTKAPAAQPVVPKKP